MTVLLIVAMWKNWLSPLRTDMSYFYTNDCIILSTECFKLNLINYCFKDHIACWEPNEARIRFAGCNYFFYYSIPQYKGTFDLMSVLQQFCVVINNSWQIIVVTYLGTIKNDRMSFYIELRPACSFYDDTNRCSNKNISSWTKVDLIIQNMILLRIK